MDESSLIINSEGKLVGMNSDFFDEFIRSQGHCFLCGRTTRQVDFNDEHVIPKWILKRFGLFDERITLINGTTMFYRNYTVPCCVECNAHLGETYEEPISELLSLEYSEFTKRMAEDEHYYRLIYEWLSLIFFKVQLKDLSLRYKRDKRQESPNIGELYDWHEFHHIHCLVRSRYTNTTVDEKVYGSLIVLPVYIVEGLNQLFDYKDSPFARCILIRLEHTCIVCALDDARACLNMFQDEYGHKITGALNEWQASEVLANFSFINLNLHDRPVFSTVGDPDGGLHITVRIPDYWYVSKEVKGSIGKYLWFYVEQHLRYLDEDEFKFMKTQTEADKASYLWENGEFKNQYRYMKQAGTIPEGTDESEWKSS